MSPFVLLGDALLILNAVSLTLLASYAWRARRSDGHVLHRLAVFLVVLAVFFDWFTIVYADRRWNVWPWADLSGFHWYWLPRLMLFAATVFLYAALMRRRR